MVGNDAVGTNFIEDLNGCFAGSKEQIIYTPAILAPPLEVTGAGDLFASGFLSAYLDKKTISECARLGSFVASFVVQNIGAEIPSLSWDHILTERNALYAK